MSAGTSVPTTAPDTAPERLDSILAQGIAARREEIAAAVLVRLRAIGPGIEEEMSDPGHLEELRTGVLCGIDYGLAALEAGEHRPPSVPTPLLSAAEAAARGGVGFDIVLRHTFAAYAVLNDFTLETVERSGCRELAWWRALTRIQAIALDRLVDQVGAAYWAEVRARQERGPERRRADHVRRLLAGEPLEWGSLGYDLDGWHLGAASSGPEAVGFLRRMGRELGLRLLLVKPEDGTVWGWFGGATRQRTEEALDRARESWPGPQPLALGEPGIGIDGWRRSHRQALAALSVARRDAGSVVAYGQVGLLASALRDDLLCDSLRRKYVGRLLETPDRGAVAIDTLRAYFEVDRNVSSTAALLGVSRPTVTSRLRVIEERFKRPLSECSAECEIAVRLYDLEHRAGGPAIPQVRFPY
ncbi:MAG TPA: helix-turn-helix domain-containing protein [Solirubrobacterales bacterium]|nr:helix-turn-helix domain-containing protein [Solirubrobacterales bacterium]